MSNKSTRSSNHHDRTLLEPTISSIYEDLEFSIHIPPGSLRRELKDVFPSGPSNGPNLIVPTFQHSQLDLLAFGEKEAAEKDRLLERFFDWSDKVRNGLYEKDSSIWIDVTDPASGLARYGAHGGIYPDVDGCVRLLRYDTLDIGGCRIIRHPKWSFAVYPGKRI